MKKRVFLLILSTFLLMCLVGVYVLYSAEYAPWDKSVFEDEIGNTLIYDDTNGSVTIYSPVSTMTNDTGAAIVLPYLAPDHETEKLLFGIVYHLNLKIQDGLVNEIIIYIDGTRHKMTLSPLNNISNENESDGHSLQKGSFMFGISGHKMIDRMRVAKETKIRFSTNTKNHDFTLPQNMIDHLVKIYDLGVEARAFNGWFGLNRIDKLYPVTVR